MTSPKCPELLTKLEIITGVNSYQNECCNALVKEDSTTEGISLGGCGWHPITLSPTLLSNTNNNTWQHVSRTVLPLLLSMLSFCAASVMWGQDQLQSRSRCSSFWRITGRSIVACVTLPTSFSSLLLTTQAFCHLTLSQKKREKANSHNFYPSILFQFFYFIIRCC